MEEKQHSTHKYHNRSFKFIIDPSIFNSVIHCGFSFSLASPLLFLLLVIQVVHSLLSSFCHLLENIPLNFHLLNVEERNQVMNSQWKLDDLERKGKGRKKKKEERKRNQYKCVSVYMFMCVSLLFFFFTCHFIICLFM